MKYILIFILLSLCLSNTLSLAEEKKMEILTRENSGVVPHVQQGGTGSFKITPSISSGNQSSNTNLSTSNQGSVNLNNKNSISVIVDYSGSMMGNPLNSAKNSTITLLDLISAWKKVYPQKFKDINFQYIQFGSSNENSFLYKLSKIDDIERLKNSIRSDNTVYSGTDYNSGIDLALSTLSNSNLNNKTIFLSDAGDNGIGPTSGKQYSKLGDTKFIIYGSGGSIPNWLNSIPSSSQFNISNEFEVMSIFVETLFEFVDDMNKYLIRRGKQRIVPKQNFEIIKHGNNVEHNTILSKPSQEIKIEKIIGPDKKVVNSNNYKIFEKETFFQIVLNSNLPKGNYEVILSKNTRSHEFFYINFEPCNIFMKLLTVPANIAGSCFLEDSKINFTPVFFDNDQKIEIKYPDFLNYVAYRYKINNHKTPDTFGIGASSLNFSETFPVGSAGSYDIWTAWNYNIGKLKQDNPPPQKIDEFCISQNGSSVKVEFDPSLAWEGRNIPFKATLLKSDAEMLKNNKIIYLNTNHSIIPLIQTSPNSNTYEGTLENVEPVLYQLSIENKNKKYNFAVDSSSITQFEGKKRLVKVSINTYDYSSMYLLTKGNIFNQVIQAFKIVASKTKSKQLVTKDYEGTSEILIPYLLPYSDMLDENAEINISLNKIFDDEIVELDLSLIDKCKSGKCEYEYKDAGVGGLNGLFQLNKTFPDAVSIEFSINGKKNIKNGEKLTQNIHILKQAGDMDFDKTLFPEPKMTLTGNLKINPFNRDLKIDNTEIILEIKTDILNKNFIKFYRLSVWIISLTILFIIILIILALLIRCRNICTSKYNEWRSIHSSILADYWQDINVISNPELEIPYILKKAFNNDKEIFVKWLELDPNNKENKKLFTEKLCKEPKYGKNQNLVKLLDIILFPINVIKCAFELNNNIITRKQLKMYKDKLDTTNSGITNIPSTWSFNNIDNVYISNNFPGREHIRLKEGENDFINISFYNDNTINILSKDSFTVYFGNIRNSILMGRPLRSPTNTSNIIMDCNNFKIQISNIDYAEKSLTVNIIKN
jgi:hypothetical protein